VTEAPTPCFPRVDCREFFGLTSEDSHDGEETTWRNDIPRPLLRNLGMLGELAEFLFEGRMS
jgi:hypothetical protein